VAQLDELRRPRQPVVQQAQDERRRFVVGLGNPGRKYAETRHNLGFRVLETLRRRWGVDAARAAFGGQVYDARPRKGTHGSRRVMLIEPQTYMNRSGRTVREATAYYKAAVDEVLVVLDDMALPVGRLRARTGGSPGGHKGLADILACLGTDEVARLRIGIGPPPGRMDGVDFVLAPFRSDEREIIEVAIETAADAVEDWVFRGMDPVMEKYNRKPED
jgi:PTH1 family peptidyl-tRNA hydrolase